MHVSDLKQLLDVVAQDQSMAQLLKTSIGFEGKWSVLPQCENDAQQFDVDVLLGLVDAMDKERPRVSEMAPNATAGNTQSFKLEEKLTRFLRRCPIMNAHVPSRIARKFPDQSGNTIKTSPLQKKTHQILRRTCCFFSHTRPNMSHGNLTPQ